MKVCTCCFNDEELKAYVLTNSTEKGKCEYCCNGLNSDLIEVDELLDFFETFINVFKSDESGISLIELIQKDWNLFAGNTEANNVLSDVLLFLNLPIEKTSQTVSYIDEITESVLFWDELKEKLKWDKRFTTDFNKLEDFGWDRIFSEKASSFVIPEGEKKLFRARIHQQNQSEKFQIGKMGTPPKEKVLAGRANPQGIPFLYLSDNENTTLYEVRASYLDEISIGTYEIKENIVLIDFSSKSLLSAFGAYSESYNNIANTIISNRLKRKISTDLSRPLRRYDSEIEYIPTQFICEYIKQIANADGILSTSSLDSEMGRNIVLFSTDKVECVSVKGVRISKVKIESENI
jgi:hypothetical protein